MDRTGVSKTMNGFCPNSQSVDGIHMLKGDLKPDIIRNHGHQTEPAPDGTNGARVDSSNLPHSTRPSESIERIGSEIEEKSIPPLDGRFRLAGRFSGSDAEGDVPRQEVFTSADAADEDL
jgi:hypothetical protein